MIIIGWLILLITIQNHSKWILIAQNYEKILLKSRAPVVRLVISIFSIERAQNWPTGTELGNLALHTIKFRLEMFKIWKITL